MKEQKNILIAGIGGQGVNALYKVLQISILKMGWASKGAIFKGGAQKRGTVYAMIRIFEEGGIESNFSPIIPEGELDLLIALEANEALRYSSFYNEQTTMIINDFTFAFYNERFRKNKGDNPIESLKVHFDNLIIEDYNALSINLFKGSKMANFLIGMEAIARNFIPVDKAIFIDVLQQQLELPYEDMVVLMNHFGI